MCGVISYKGFRNPKEVVLTGLKRMEYRGYDSAGAVLLNSSGQLKRWRTEGALKNLKQTMEGENNFKSLGMGHIRWATHGPPVKKNAHPHKAGPLYLAHNGVIENAQELKQTLPGPFVSDTDSEIMAWALSSAWQKFGCLKQAVQSIMPRLKGEYAAIALQAEPPYHIIAFKKGPSLAVGLGENETFIASSFQAYLPYTKKTIFLKDGDIAYLTSGQNLQFYESTRPRPVHKKPQILTPPIAPAEGKGSFKHYMLKEIYDQPACIAQVVKTYTDIKTKNPQLILKGRQNIWDDILAKKQFYITACGSSYYAALYGKYVIERLARISTHVDMSSEFRYRSPVLLKGAPVMCISQSGETADTLAALRMVRGLNSPVLSLCNTADSSIEQQADALLDMLAGEEKSVASTKAFTCTLTILFLIAVHLAQKAGCLSRADGQNMVRGLSELPSVMEELLSYEQLYASSAELLKSAHRIIYLGRAEGYPLALEGALKMKELAYRHAEAYPAGEMKHGPLALVDKNTAVAALAPAGRVYGKMLTNLQEAQARGARLIVIGSKGDQKACKMAAPFVPLPACKEESLSLIASALPLQLLAYHTACRLGCHVDQPRNLAKSVTVE